MSLKISKLVVLTVKINQVVIGYELESPRVLVRNGKLAQASDVVDMLSLEQDPAKRTEETVRESIAEDNLRHSRFANQPASP